MRNYLQKQSKQTKKQQQQTNIQTWGDIDAIL